MAIKRMNYFKGEFLQAQDFKDEQQYHVDMLRSHNKNLHTWGVADGLDITFVAGEKKITVKKGTAIDVDGRQIVLVEDKAIDLSASTETTLYVTVSYKEIPTDPRDETGIKDNTRITEEPDIKHEKDKPSDPSVDLILGKVILNPDKTIKEIDKSERKNAGVVGGDLEVKSLAFSLPIATDQWPRIKGVDGGSPGIEITSQDSIFKGNLSIQGNISITGTVDGRDISSDGGKLDAHVTALNPHSGALSKSGDTMTGSLTINNGNLIVNTGNISVGTTGPMQKLTVSGSEATPHGFGASIGIVNKAAGGKSWYLRSGATGTATPVGGFSIADDAAYRLVIDNAGNIGIGITNPAAGKLQFLNELGNKVVLWDGGATDRYGIGLSIGNLNVFIPPVGRFSIRNNGFDGVEQFVVKGTGNVGIGTANPGDYKLNIGGTGGDNALFITSDFGLRGNNKLNLIKFGNDGDYQVLHKAAGAFGRNTLALHCHADDAFGVYSTGWNPLLEVKGGSGDVYVRGNIGVGTTNPQYKLHINGPLVVQQTHAIKIGVPSPATPPRYGNDGIRGEPNLWLDAAGTVYIKPGFQTPTGFDIAERFKTDAQVEPGHVVVFDDEEKAVKLCGNENDNRVVGIASTEPAFILGGDNEQMPIALCGRVLCKVDADIAPIITGDLLTTSPTRGHAQKVLDSTKSVGAIIGKALEPLSKGKREIMILVTLQ